VGPKGSSEIGVVEAVVGAEWLGERVEVWYEERLPIQNVKRADLEGFLRRGPYFEEG
jgi:hypothetical protein